MLKRIDWPEYTAQVLASGTFLLAGYGLGSISVTIFKLFAA